MADFREQRKADIPPAEVLPAPRARSVRTLEESERFLRLSQTAGGVGSWEVDLVARRVRWSGAMCKLHGVEMDHFDEDLANLEAFIQPEDRDSVRAGIDRAIRTGSFNDSEYRIVTTKGESRTVWARGDVAFDPEGRPERILGTAVDITERKESQRVIALYRMLVEHTSETIQLIDPKSGRFVFMNAQGRSDLGYAEHEISSLNIADVDSELGQPDVATRLGKLALAHTTTMERVLRRRDGSTFPIAIKMSVVNLDQQYILVIGRNLTTRKRIDAPAGNAAAETEPEGQESLHATSLELSEASLRAILSSASDSIVTTDEVGTVLQINPAVTRTFGFSADELIGRNFAVLVPDREYAQTRNMAFAGREVTCLRKDGTTFPAELSVAEFFVRGQRRYTGVLRDITERRRIEINMANDDLRIRTGLAYDLHDSFGQLVAGARILTENLMRDAPKKLHARLGRVVGLLAEAIDKVRKMSRNLAAIETIEAPLGAALSALAGEMSLLCKARFSVNVTSDFLEPTREQKNQVYLVAREAMLNAAKHGQCRYVYVMLGLTAGGYELRVSDDGIGFAEARGGGLGLASMQYRARLLGGNVTIGRGPHGGIEVHLRWPAEALY